MFLLNFMSGIDLIFIVMNKNQLYQYGLSLWKHPIYQASVVKKRIFKEMNENGVWVWSCIP